MTPQVNKSRELTQANYFLKALPLTHMDSSAFLLDNSSYAKQKQEYKTITKKSLCRIALQTKCLLKHIKPNQNDI